MFIKNPKAFITGANCNTLFLSFIFTFKFTNPVWFPLLKIFSKTYLKTLRFAADEYWTRPLQKGILENVCGRISIYLKLRMAALTAAILKIINYT